jgi:hypothetical protein
MLLKSSVAIQLQKKSFPSDANSVFTLPKRTRVTLTRRRISETVGQIEKQHRQLSNAYRNEFALKAALDTYAKRPIQTFEEAWHTLEGRFDVLRDFCGGIATVFPNTASVESDFSILGYEKDAHRLSITDLALEGVMQSKQYVLLESLQV